MTNDELDPAGPILAALFETASSDSIITVVDRAGLPIDWTLNQSQAYSNKTRKREYRLRVGEALNAIRPPDRTGALSRIALGASEAPSVDIESLNRALAPTGWLFVDGELCPLIQGPTASDAPAITPGVRAIAVIVTALDLEACAIRDHLSEIVEEPHEKGTVYFTGRFDDGGRRWKVAVVIAGPGNPTAAVEVERAAAHYSPSVLLLVGVAGALKDLDLGDVVAADKVYGYERGRAEHQFLPRPTFGLSTYPAIQRARAEVYKSQWQKRIKGERPSASPRAVVAPIAAGEKVVAAFDSPEFQNLRSLFSDAVAVEMEGAGFLAGAHSNIGVNALVVRGISDRVDGKGAADSAGSQQRAARHAAAFAFQFLANFGDSTKSTPSPHISGEEIPRLLRESRARCIERWQGTGVSRELAAALADDSAVGVPQEDIRPSTSRPFVVLVGDFGAGKSLQTERLYQEALRRCLNDRNAPIPIHIELFPNRLPHLSELRSRAVSLGDVESVGAAVFIERSDEGGQAHALDCLALGRRITAAWPSTTVVMPTRQMSAFADTPEVIHASLLSKTEACALVSRVSGYPFREQDRWRWSGTLEGALRRPLFAILVGLYLQTEREQNEYLSAGELIGRVVTQALQRNRRDLTDAERLLSKLGVESVDAAGEFIHYGRIGSLLEMEALFGSGLVSRRGDKFGFSIPVIGQWFAAQAVIKRQTSVKAIISDRRRADLWRYPFSIVAASSDDQIVNELLEQLTVNDPGFAAMVLDDAVGQAFGRRSSQSDISPNCEEGLQKAWSGWIGGVGNLSAIADALDDRGHPLTVRASQEQRRLSIYWYENCSENLTNVDGHALGWSWRYVSLDDQSGQPAWPWQFMLDTLKGSIRKSLCGHSIPNDDSNPLSVEAVWAGALELAGHGCLYPGPLQVDDIERALRKLPGQATHIRIYEYGDMDVSIIRRAIRRLKEAGITELRSPTPTRDITSPTDGWVWSFYTESRLLERTRVVYELALAGYAYMVEHWFVALRSRMWHSATFPVRFKGILTPSSLRRGGGDFGEHPRLDYWFEPLPFGTKSQVEIVLAPAPGFLIDDFDETALRLLRQMRPDAANWIWSGKGSTALRVFGACPATDIAYDWIALDLERLKWA